MNVANVPRLIYGVKRVRTRRSLVKCRLKCVVTRFLKSPISLSLSVWVLLRTILAFFVSNLHSLPRLSLLMF